MAQFRARTKAGWGASAATGEDHRATISAESEGCMMVGGMSPQRTSKRCWTRRMIIRNFRRPTSCSDSRSRSWSSY
ncbi:unnamed protein product [Ascophyllum nodosum]